MLAFQNVIARMPYPALLVDQYGVVIFANRAAIDTLGVQEIGLPLAELVPHEGLAALLAATIGTDEVQHLEITWEGGRVFSTDLIPVAGVGAAVCLHEITALRRLLALKSDLITIVSHDLRNPLGVAIGFAEILAEEPGLSSEARMCVDGIRSSLTKMLSMVNNVLDLVRAEASARGDVSASDVAAVIEQVVEDLAPHASAKGQTLRVSTPEGLPRVLIDPVYLTEALRNLVENAIKYAPSGSVVQIRAESLDGQRRVKVSVQDSGPGIPAEAKPRLFERFFRVSSRHTLGKEGAGLGLTIVRTIIENHRGQVGVESEEGRGSTFWFWLPAA